MSAENKNAADVSLNDIKDTVGDKIEDAQEAVNDFREDTEAKVNALNGTQKVLLLTGGVLVVTTLVQVVLNKFRKPAAVVLVEVEDEPLGK